MCVCVCLVYTCWQLSVCVCVCTWMSRGTRCGHANTHIYEDASALRYDFTQSGQRKHRAEPISVTASMGLKVNSGEARAESVDSQTEVAIASFRKVRGTTRSNDDYDHHHCILALHIKITIRDTSSENYMRSKKFSVQYAHVAAAPQPQLPVQVKWSI